jgi:hypothetical protein
MLLGDDEDEEGSMLGGMDALLMVEVEITAADVDIDVDEVVGEVMAVLLVEENDADCDPTSVT